MHFGFGERKANCMTYRIAQGSLLIRGSHIIYLRNYLMRWTINFYSPVGLCVIKEKGAV